jgi:hypothetical protein
VSKYRNKPTKLNGYNFDSVAEAGRYADLCLLVFERSISALEVHPVFELQPAFVDSTGKRQRAIKYEADFAYTENGKIIVEDVKGFETQTWRIKKRLFLYKYPEYELRVIK